MRMALRLAVGGMGSVEPNPAVGTVLVKNGHVIGRGWHKKFGGPHAEIEALSDCKKRGKDPAGATMYVTLEPCCHYGKTGPCTDAIIAAKIGRVVAAAIDPSKHANGQGLKRLRNAGIKTAVGVCENEARLLNAPFLKCASTEQCWVILKWAQSKDSKMAWTKKNRRWISSKASRRDVHKIRRRVQAILVGIKTVLADNPLLTVRPEKEKQPLRIVLDTNLRIPLQCKLLKTVSKAPVLVVTGKNTNPEKRKKLAEKGAEVVTVPMAKGRSDLKYLLKLLSKRGIAQLLVEGGAKVITSFLKQHLADEVVIYIAPKVLGEKGTTQISRPMARLAQRSNLYYREVKKFDGDVRITGLTRQAVRQIAFIAGQL
jgi:diaminohydroxyphosphoribosylaminopyrimidine deaminase/5-amino-6-(5-phosphoribosylamino)uracil reductase